MRGQRIIQKEEMRNSNSTIKSITRAPKNLSYGPSYDVLLLHGAF